MSCGGGCGQLPHSIMVRLEAARIAVNAIGVDTTGNPDKFTNMANAVHAFLIAGLGEKGEKALDEHKHEGGTANGSQPQAVFMRNSFLNAPLAGMVTLPERVVDMLEAYGVSAIGGLCQADPSYLGDAGLDVEEQSQVLAELKARGLTMGVDSDQLRQWIKTGEIHGKGEHEEGA